MHVCYASSTFLRFLPNLPLMLYELADKASDKASHKAAARQNVPFTRV